MHSTEAVGVSRIGNVQEHDAGVMVVQVVEGDEEAEGKGGGRECAKDVEEEVVFHDGSNWVAFK